MSSFDRTDARLLLEICRYTYAASCPSETNAADLQDALNYINLSRKPDEFVPLRDDKPVHTSFACLVAYPDRNIVSYMGTKTEHNGFLNTIQSVDDWMKNMEVVPVPFTLSSDQLGADIPERGNLGGWVHAGFLEELGAIQAKVIRELLKRGGKTRPLYVTGHSQGGAEAALATRAFLAGGFQVAATYTFAAPRPGDKVFAQTIPDAVPVYRIEFGDDIVPHVPPTAMSWLVKLSIWGLLQYKNLPEHVTNLLKRLKNASNNMHYAGVGRLYYGNDVTKTLAMDISAADEGGTLFRQRLASLIKNPGHWGEHHHLAGTSNDQKAGKNGNYTALVSDFAAES